MGECTWDGNREKWVWLERDFGCPWGRLGDELAMEKQNEVMSVSLPHPFLLLQTIHLGQTKLLITGCQLLSVLRVLVLSMCFFETNIVKYNAGHLRLLTNTLLALCAHRRKKSLISVSSSCYPEFCALNTRFWGTTWGTTFSFLCKCCKSDHPHPWPMQPSVNLSPLKLYTIYCLVHSFGIKHSVHLSEHLLGPKHIFGFSNCSK